MKECILFFNSSVLGGAERSSLHQSLMVNDFHFKYVIPIIEEEDEASELYNFLLMSQVKRSDISLLRLNKSYYSISRKNFLLKVISATWGYFKIIRSLNNKDFKNSHVWWLSGNKIAFIFVFFATFTRFKGKVIWHFRDYPNRVIIFKTFIKINRIFSRYKLLLIGNSRSVSESLKKLYKTSLVDYVYNPVGEKLIVRDITSFKTIGVVAMFTPWKGIHQIIMMASLYENELKSLGIHSIKIYGGDIYKTEGDHMNYSSELLRLKNKFKSSLVTFEGRATPQTIYSNIDILIHSSVEKEPFGRVIIEAFNAKIPVISSSLGGASELISNELRGLTYFINDYSHLFFQIKNLIKNSKETEERIIRAYEFSKEINDSIGESLTKIFK